MLAGWVADEAGLREAQAAAGDPPRNVLAAALECEGRLARLQGDYAVARRALDQALTLYRQLDDRAGMATALTNFGSAALRQGDFQAAWAAQEESLSLYRALGDERGEAAALLNLGNVARRQGDFERATALRQASLERYRAVEDPQGTALALLNLGIVACDAGQHASAVELLEESLREASAIDDWYAISRAKLFLCEPLIALSKTERAEESCAEALSIRRDRSDSDGIAYCLEGFAAVAAVESQAAAAARLLGAAEMLRERIRAPLAGIDRRLVQQATAAAARALGEERFREELQAGRTMRLGEALQALQRGLQNGSEWQ